jgi:hypothetical protein
MCQFIQKIVCKGNISFSFYRVTQSRSFQMLQGWISDSEKTVPTAVAPPSHPATTSVPPPNKSAGSQSFLI